MILITGGAGYIGLHSAIDILNREASFSLNLPIKTTYNRKKKLVQIKGGEL